MADDPSEQPTRLRIPPADLLIALAILLATFAAYAAVFHFDFVAVDDANYVINNTHLRAGLSLQTLKWMFLSGDPDNWFPVTRLSLFLDYHLFGPAAGSYHAENIVIHGLAAILLFGFLRRATSARWPSAFVAFMFALHPLHVESVAWIAERKDVLCAFFWFAALWAWLRYIERPGAARYAFALILFSLGLMSKPMIVTLPFLLFLLDVWPFRRRLSGKRITEKIPFLALSCTVMAITVIAQRSAHAIQQLNDFPLSLRVENALITVVFYIADTLWPARLWFPHSYPRSLPLWSPLTAAAGIAVVSFIVLRQLRKRPYLSVGWFWFLITLVPVIGLIQVGLQARADRYMYVPMIGLSLVLAWGAGEAVTRWPRLRKPAAVLGVAACLVMTVQTSLQAATWADSETLFQHAINMDSQDYLAWAGLGMTIAMQHPERALDAVPYYRSAIRIRPDNDFFRNNLANILCQAKRYDEGIAEYREAIRINPQKADLHNNLALALGHSGRFEDAIEEYRQALRIDPERADVHNNLAVALCSTGRMEAGIAEYREAIRLDPADGKIHSNLAVALGQMGRQREALHETETGYRLKLGLEPVTK